MVVGIEQPLHTDIDNKAPKTELAKLGEFPRLHLVSTSFFFWKLLGVFFSLAWLLEAPWIFLLLRPLSMRSPTITRLEKPGDTLPIIFSKYGP